MITRQYVVEVTAADANALDIAGGEIAELVCNFTNSADEGVRAEMFEPAALDAVNALALLREAAASWPQMDATDEPECIVDACDVVEFFAAWRQRAKAALQALDAQPAAAERSAPSPEVVATVAERIARGEDPLTGKPRDPAADRPAGGPDPIAEYIEQHLDEGCLDDAVIEEKNAEASGINNDGIAAQVAYLRSNGWDDAMIAKAARGEV